MHRSVRDSGEGLRVYSASATLRVRSNTAAMRSSREKWLRSHWIRIPFADSERGDGMRAKL